MNFSVIETKKVDNGKIDLLSNYLVINFDAVKIDEWILVDDQSAGLLDLISYAMYGTENYCDIIKKFNKIDNPLAIPIGQIIAIPNLASLESNSYVVTPQSMKLQHQKTFSTKLKQREPTKKTIPSSNFNRSSNGNVVF